MRRYEERRVCVCMCVVKELPSEFNEGLPSGKRLLVVVMRRQALPVLMAQDRERDMASRRLQKNFV